MNKLMFVVDTNVLFTFFWNASVSRELFVSQDLDLYSPEYAIEELKRYRDEIMKKAGLSESEFDSIVKELKMLVKFVSLETYVPCFRSAVKITPDKDDVDFVALALKLRCSIWSNDNLLNEQKNIKVWSTKEVIELFD
ncbi:hypothetical protein HY485_02470 [Candidatus Woesearchaeota archaeon]|nr:hypothetical protein [Candidatus Woesearchaeota archaeon]